MQVNVVRLADYLDVEMSGPLDLPHLLAVMERVGRLTKDHGDERLVG